MILNRLLWPHLQINNKCSRKIIWKFKKINNWELGKRLGKNPRNSLQIFQNIWNIGTYSCQGTLGFLLEIMYIFILAFNQQTSSLPSGKNLLPFFTICALVPIHPVKHLLSA